MKRELKIIKNILSPNILLEELEYLNSKSSNKWAITFGKKNSIRILFAKLIVLTMSDTQIWMSVNPDLIKKSHDKIWKWSVGDYPVFTRYKQIKIHNGYIINPSLETWNQIKKCHFDIIDQISETNYVLDIRTMRNQNKYIFHALSQTYKTDFPIPSYVLEHEYSEFKKSTLGSTMSSNITQTEKEQISKVRIGQSYFREKLLMTHGKCIICGLKNKALLRASHIKSWSKSGNFERLDVNNGLLLCTLHDSLFDSGLISFSDKGNIIISDDLAQEDLQILKINQLKIDINQQTLRYLSWHRKNVLKKKN